MIEPVIYEVCIAVEDDDVAYRVEHGFATLPSLATLVALRDEAASVFHALYADHHVGEQLVYVRRLTPDETPTNHWEQSTAQGGPTNR